MRRSRVPVAVVSLIGCFLLSAHVVGATALVAASRSWRVEGNQEFANLGYSVGSAGDVNGDGFDDVIVGAPTYDNGEADEGRALVYQGSASGLGTAPAWAVESNLFEARWGWSVGTAGDVNGDGFDDVIVGAPFSDDDLTARGRAVVYLGSASGLATTFAWTAVGEEDQAKFGWSVGSAGDVNGDGFDDVIVGAPDIYVHPTGEGRAYLYLGSAAGLDTVPAWTAEGHQDFAYLGSSVGTAGDVNGDAFDDVVVGAVDYDNGQTNEGAALVYLGSSSGLRTKADWTAEGGQDQALLGASVGTAGDVNADGFDDVIVGADGYTNGQVNEGRALVYLGSASGPGIIPAWTAEGDQEYAGFGGSVGTAGDVNADGFGDVIVGADGYTNGQTAEGLAFSYLGSPSGLGTTPAKSVESNQKQADFGFSVGTAGDVDGDGFDDVIIGSPGYHHPERTEGAAFVF